MPSDRKTNRRRPDRQLDVSEEGRSKRLAFALECSRLPKVDFSDYDAVKERIDWYFDECTARGLRPGVEGLCTALHTRRQQLSKWALGERRAGQGYQELIQNARQVLADQMEQDLMNGDINPVAGIFLASNNFDYDRNATVTVQTQPQLVAEEDPRRLAEKYRADVIDVSAQEPTPQLEPVKAAEDK